MKYGLGGLLFAVALAVSPVAAQSPGITDTSIKLGTQAPMSGVVAMIGMVAEGQKLKFDAVNAAGGVKMGDGKTRQVELVIMDDANEPPRTVTNARRMAEQNKVFAFVGSGRHTTESSDQGLHDPEQDSEHIHLFGHLRMGRRKAEPLGHRHGAFIHHGGRDLREIS